MKTHILNGSWLVNFHIREQKNLWDVARRHHWSENCTSPYWKDYTLWLQTYSQQVFVEWISQSISKAVYSCIMLKEGQNYETSGQLLLSRLLNNNCDFGTERSVTSDLSYFHLDEKLTEKHDYATYSAWDYIISTVLPDLGFSACDILAKSIRNSPSFLVSVGRIMITEDSLESCVE